jgi:hypothetical protein
MRDFLDISQEAVQKQELRAVWVARHFSVVKPRAYDPLLSVSGEGNQACHPTMEARART